MADSTPLPNPLPKGERGSAPRSGSRPKGERGNAPRSGSRPKGERGNAPRSGPLPKGERGNAPRSEPLPKGERGSSVDPILLQIVEGTLHSIEAQVEAAIERTARSPMIRDQHDYRAGIHDRLCR